MINEIQLDALREVGSIGCGNAASSLSNMLSKQVSIAVPKIKVLDYQTVVENLGGPEQLLVGILISLQGDVTGMIMFLLRKEFAQMVLEELTGDALEDNGQMNELSKSAIEEVGNIMASSYISAMCQMTGLKIKLSVPSLCVDMAGAILSVPASLYANVSDKLIFVEDEFKHKMDHPSSQILLIPEVDSLGTIMRSLGLGE